MANNEHVNKVVYGNQTLIDLSSDTVTPQGLQAGLTAHDASGALITGTNEGGSGEGYVWQDAQGYVHLSDNQGTDFVANIIADPYDSTATYDVGDYCSYNGLFYQCNTAISTAEAWNANHWTQLTVVDALGNAGSGDSPYDMVVSISANVDTTTSPATVSNFVSDKTFTEITTAYSNGDNIVCKFSMSKYDGIGTLQKNLISSSVMYRDWVGTNGSMAFDFSEISPGNASYLADVYVLASELTWYQNNETQVYEYAEDQFSASDIEGKADKVFNATNGNFAALDSNGNLTDSGHKHSDYLTQHQDISGKLNAPAVAGTAGQVLGLNSSNATVWVDQSTGLPTVTSSDNGKVLGVTNGAWAKTDAPESPYDMVVRVLYLSYWDDDLNNQVDTYEKSATFEEVYAAYQQGKSIILNYQECFDSTRSYIYNLGCFTLAEGYSNELIFHRTDFVATYDYSTDLVDITGTTYFYMSWYPDQTESEGDPEYFDLMSYQTGIFDDDDIFDTIVASATLTPSSYSTNVTTSYMYGTKSEYVYTGYQITSGSEEYFTSPVTITPSGASYTPQFTVATATAPTASVTIEIYMTRKH